MHNRSWPVYVNGRAFFHFGPNRHFPKGFVFNCTDNCNCCKCYNCPCDDNLAKENEKLFGQRTQDVYLMCAGIRENVRKD